MREKAKKMSAEVTETPKRMRIVIRGAVQGVGFRPFIFRLANDLRLPGWVKNSSGGVVIEIEGEIERLERFLLRIEPEKPPRSFIQGLEYSYLDPAGYTAFEILESDRSGAKVALVLPDIAICPDCLTEIFDPNNRRYLYPFTNCTNCGPRYTIITALPYDRPNTTMSGFAMCEKCRAEYENPYDRRFHAQPNACPDCGPHLELWDGEGKIISKHHGALLGAIDAIRGGQIVAVKGIGGFHLMVDARNEVAVRRLRELKKREEKPLAVMFPSMEMVEQHCQVSEIEKRLLASPEAPIVLLEKKARGGEIAESVAPENPYLGVMLPYSPLHHILMAKFGFPAVATSGNMSEESICTDEMGAVTRLQGVADFFLIHNRPIIRAVDDSVVRVMAGRELVLRRARGYAPMPIHISRPLPKTIAVGGHLKNSIAISIDRNIFVSQHIGDLETMQTYETFQNTIKSLCQLYDFKPECIVCDEHPAYLSTAYALKTNLTIFRVQHHYAHILSCMAENELSPPLLGVAWDGTGYGLDSTIWGGEFFRVTDNGFERAAYFRPFRLPGGEKAIKEPRRAALAVLHQIFGDSLLDRRDLKSIDSFSDAELKVLTNMLEKSVNSPYTTSAGRLFDVVSSIIGIRQVTHFEGQAAMELEFLLDPNQTMELYRFEFGKTKSAFVVDWRPMIRDLLDDLKSGVPVAAISAKFHNTMSEIIVAIAQLVGEKKVVLSGGCFQNKYLTESAIAHLTKAGFQPYWHQRIPPNDGGISLGQAVAALNLKK